MHLVGIEDALPVHRDSLDVRRPRPASDQNFLSAYPLHSPFVHDLDRVRIAEVCVALQRRHVIAPQLRLDHVHFPRHHRRRAQHQVRHYDPVLHHVSPPVKRPLPQPAQVQHRLPHHFARDRSRMNANSSHRQPPVDDRHFLAHLRRANCPLLSRRSAPNDHQIVFIRLHKVFLADARN